MTDLPDSCIQTDTLLRRKGFQCQEVETGDVFSRRRFYHKDYREDDSNVMVRVELKFELSIQDAPGGSYDDNHHLYHEETSLTFLHKMGKILICLLFSGLDVVCYGNTRN